MFLSRLYSHFQIWRMYRASYCNAYINQRDAQILVNYLYFFVNWLYIFRTLISPSSGAAFHNGAIGTCRYVWLLYTTARRTGMYSTVQLNKCCSWWWTKDSPKHVEPFNEKIKTIHKNLCVSLVYIHIAIWCTVHRASNWDLCCCWDVMQAVQEEKFFADCLNLDDRTDRLFRNTDK